MAFKLAEAFVELKARGHEQVVKETEKVKEKTKEIGPAVDQAAKSIEQANQRVGKSFDVVGDRVKRLGKDMKEVTLGMQREFDRLAANIRQGGVMGGASAFTGDGFMGGGAGGASRGGVGFGNGPGSGMGGGAGGAGVFRGPSRMNLGGGFGVGGPLGQLGVAALGVTLAFKGLEAAANRYEKIASDRTRGDNERVGAGIVASGLHGPWNAAKAAGSTAESAILGKLGEQVLGGAKLTPGAFPVQGRLEEWQLTDQQRAEEGAVHVRNRRDENVASRNRETALTAASLREQAQIHDLIADGMSEEAAKAKVILEATEAQVAAIDRAAKAEQNAREQRESRENEPTPIENQRADEKEFKDEADKKERSTRGMIKDLEKEAMIREAIAGGEDATLATLRIKNDLSGENLRIVENILGRIKEMDKQDAADKKRTDDAIAQGKKFEQAGRDQARKEEQERRDAIAQEYDRQIRNERPTSQMSMQRTGIENLQDLLQEAVFDRADREQEAKEEKRHQEAQDNRKGILKAAEEIAKGQGALTDAVKKARARFS